MALEEVIATEEPPGRGSLLEGSSIKATHEVAHCPHGVPVGGMCPHCLNAARSTQHVWQERIPGLLEKSKRQYSRAGQVEDVLQSVDTNSVFTIETVSPEDTDTLTTVHRLLGSVFDPEELEDLDVLQQSLGGLTPYGTPTHGKNRVFVVRDEVGDIRSILTGGNLDILDENSKPTGETVFLRGYSYTDPNLRRTGFARELHLSALIDAATIAQQTGKRLALVGSEAVGSAEPAWNSVGLRRVYRQESDDTFLELRYIQPALKFDAHTGEVDRKSRASDMPEHLMVDNFGEEISGNSVLAVVDAFYRWNNRRPRRAFSSDEAYFVHRGYVDSKLNQMSSFLNEGNIVTMLGSRRENLMQGGASFYEHVDANHK